MREMVIRCNGCGSIISDKPIRLYAERVDRDNAENCFEAGLLDDEADYCTKCFTRIECFIAGLSFEAGENPPPSGKKEVRKVNKTSRDEITPEKLRELYITEGLTIKQTADRLQVGVQTVKTLMNRYGIQRRKRGTGKKNTGRKPVVNNPERVQAVAEMEVAETGVNCTDEVLKNCIYGNTNGIPTCDYISVTGHQRGCDPKHCTRYRSKCEE